MQATWQLPGAGRRPCALAVPCILIAVLILGPASTRAASIWPVSRNGPTYTADKLYPLGLLNSVDGHVAAFGDFNSDTYVDVFLVDPLDSSVVVYLWDHDTYDFHQEPVTRIVTGNHTVANVVPADFNHDGYLDVLIQGRAAGNPDELWNRIYHGLIRRSDEGAAPKFQLSQQYEALENSTGHLLVMDWNNDQLPDLFGQIAETPPRRVIWRNGGDGKPWVIEQQLHSETLWPLTDPASSSFVDMDGDCIPDLVLTSASGGQTRLEVWRNSGVDGYKLSRQYALMQGAGLLSFADLDQDGDMDLVIPVCWPADTCADHNGILLASNTQMPMCRTGSSGKCRESSNLCVPDTAWSLPTEISDWRDASTAKLVVASSVFDGAVLAPPGDKDRALRVHVGDHNTDGFPDVLALVRASASAPTTVRLLQNVPCTSALCGVAAAKAGRRTLGPPRTSEGARRSADALAPLQNIQNVVATAFFDLDETGVLDILVISEASGRRKSHFVFNNFWIDAYFVKTVGLNGLCTAWCDKGERFPDPKPYGVNHPGGVFKFTVTDIDGVKQVSTGTQLTSSGYMSLQTPYNLFGLGRTNNYLEEFYYGVAGSGPVMHNLWPGIIPNSQLIAIPYPIDEPSKWTIELFVNPAAWLPYVTLTSVVAMAVLGIVVAWYHRQELLEDERLKEEEASRTLFSFNL